MLTKKTYQQSVKIEQLSTLCEENQRERDILDKTLVDLRTMNKELDHRVFTQEKTITQLEVRHEALNQQLCDKEQVLTKTSQLLDGAHDHKVRCPLSVLIASNLSIPHSNKSMKAYECIAIITRFCIRNWNSVSLKSIRGMRSSNRCKKRSKIFA